MKITGSYDIEADRETVWRALNDPEVLRACIPGCESLEKADDNTLNAEVTAKVGPVKAKFAGSVELKDLNPPESYRIEGSGKGGAAGFAKGGADVRLSENGSGGTTLSYEADAQVGGKLAQIGSRLIDGTARKLADQFFDNFRNYLTPGVAPTEPAAAPAPEPVEVPEAETEPEPAPAPEPETEPKPEPRKEPERAREPQAAPTAPRTAGAEPGPTPAEPRLGLPAWVWLLGAVILILVLVALVS